MPSSLELDESDEETSSSSLIQDDFPTQSSTAVGGGGGVSGDILDILSAKDMVGQRNSGLSARSLQQQSAAATTKSGSSTTLQARAKHRRPHRHQNASAKRSTVSAGALGSSDLQRIVLDSRNRITDTGTIFFFLLLKRLPSLTHSFSKLQMNQKTTTLVGPHPPPRLGTRSPRPVASEATT